MHLRGDGVSLRLLVILSNIPHSSRQAVNASARRRNVPFSKTLALYPNFLTRRYSTTRTPVAPGCLILPLHYLNRVASLLRAWKMGCAGFIHQSQECCPLLLFTSPTSYNWIPGTWYHIIFIFQSYVIRQLKTMLLMYQQHARNMISDHIL